jgi:hypothetical protein
LFHTDYGHGSIVLLWSLAFWQNLKMEVADAVTGGISGNPYFNAGFGLTLLAGGLAFAKRAAMVGMQQIRRASTVTLEVTSKDKSYPWVLSWINAQVMFFEGMKHFHLFISRFLVPCLLAPRVLLR